MSLDRAFELVIEAEGGYVNDPRDPGGETKFGISRRAYPTLDIKGLTREQAKEIYERDYWLAAKCQLLPWPLSAVVFDCAVNQGVGTAITLLQKALGLTQDGVVGPKTLAAAKASGEEGVALYLAERTLRYTRTSGWVIYGRGWVKRLFLLTLECGKNEGLPDS